MSNWYLQNKLAKQFSFFVTDRSPLTFKTLTVEECPTPRKSKDQGFANFHQRFIKNYSQTATHLTHLTLNKKRPSPGPESALPSLKGLFTFASISVQPDHANKLLSQWTLPGGGVLLLLCTDTNSHINPCVYFWKLHCGHWDLGTFSSQALLREITDLRAQSCHLDQSFIYRSSYVYLRNRFYICTLHVYL